MKGKFIGIDISKQTFDVAFKKEKWNFFELANNSKGFEVLSDLIEEGDWIIMEASGPYYLPLANYLYARQIK